MALRERARVPVEFERAVHALQACASLDEARYWSDKADALAAWAKIYRNDDVGRQARVLKLHAFRRMGQLAQELRPRGVHKTGLTKKQRNAQWLKRKKTGAPAPFVPKGEKPGPLSLLKENGLSEARARVVLTIAKMPAKSFEAATRARTPPSPHRLMEGGRENHLWRELTQHLYRLRGFARRASPQDVARVASDSTSAHQLIAEISRWLERLKRERARNAPFIVGEE